MIFRGAGIVGHHPSGDDHARWLPLLGLSLALLRGCAAQSVGCGSSSISTQVDADKLSNCAKIYGDVSVAAAENIVLSGVANIYGSLVIDTEDTAELTSFSAPDLQWTQNALTITGAVKNVSLAALETVSSFSSDSNTLSQLDIPKGLHQWDANVTSATSFIFVNSSQLTELPDIFFTNITNITITNNPQLQSVRLPLKGVNGCSGCPSIVIYNNGGNSSGSPGLAVEFPSLQSVHGVVDIYDVASVSLSKLEEIHDHFTIHNMTGEVLSFNSLRLVETDNDTFTDYKMLEIRETMIANLSFPVLEIAQEMSFADNLNPALYDQISLSSDATIFHLSIEEHYSVDCAKWSNLYCSGVITQGDCNNATFSSDSCTSGPSPTVIVPGAVILSVLVLAIVCFSYRRQKQRKRQWLYRGRRTEARDMTASLHDGARSQDQVVYREAVGEDVALPKYSAEAPPPVYFRDREVGAGYTTRSSMSDVD